MANRVVGVDIGSRTIRAVEVENPTKAKPTVIRYHEVALPDGAARSGEVVETHTVASTLKMLWSTGGFSSKNVVLGVGNQRVLARDLTLPKMSAVQIRESLPFQVQDMLPMPVGDALLDFYPVSESAGENGPVINGLLVAAVKEAVLGNVTSVQLAGLNPVEVDLIPFALARVHSRTASTPATVAFVDVGASTTNVVVSIAGVPQFVRIIPSGGNDVTKALMARLEMSDAVANQAKFALGLPSGALNPDHRPIYEVIYDTTTELLNSIRNTISYFDNTHEVPNVALIVLSGGGTKLGGFPNALTELTKTQVVLNEPFSTVTVAKKAAATAEQASESMTVALGLALGSAA